MEEEEDMVVKEGLMASQREIFSISGPIHLTSIDWYLLFQFFNFQPHIILQKYLSTKKAHH